MQTAAGAYGTSHTEESYRDECYEEYVNDVFGALTRTDGKWKILRVCFACRRVLPIFLWF